MTPRISSRPESQIMPYAIDMAYGTSHRICRDDR